MDSYQQQAEAEMWDAIAANDPGPPVSPLDTRDVHRLSRAENANTVGALEKRGASLKAQLAEVVEELERIVRTARAVLEVKTSEQTRDLATGQLEQATHALEQLAS